MYNTSINRSTAEMQFFFTPDVRKHVRSTTDPNECYIMVLKVMSLKIQMVSACVLCTDPEPGPLGHRRVAPQGPGQHDRRAERPGVWRLVPGGQHHRRRGAGQQHHARPPGQHPAQCGWVQYRAGTVQERTTIYLKIVSWIVSWIIGFVFENN